MDSDGFDNKVASDVEAIESNKEIMYSRNDMTFQSPLSNRYRVSFFLRIWGKKLWLSATEVAKLDARTSDKISIILSKVRDERSILWAAKCIQNSINRMESVGPDLDPCLHKLAFALHGSVAEIDIKSLKKMHGECERHGRGVSEDMEPIRNIVAALDELTLAVLRFRGEIETEDENIQEMAENAAALGMLYDDEEEWQLKLLVKMAGGRI